MADLYFTLVTVGIAAAVFGGFLLFVELGRRLGVRQLAKRGQDAHAGKGSVDGAVYALLALLIGFAFSGAAARYDARRNLVVDEVGMARTAWLRLATLPPESQEVVRSQFLRYVDAVIAWHESADPEQARNQHVAVMDAQTALWDRSVAASLATPQGEKARMLLLPALNELYGAVEHEHLAQRVHMPLIVFLMLAVAALASGLFAGYGMAGAAKRNWVYILGSGGTIAAALCVIIELETPRLGLVRVDRIDSALVELRSTMSAPYSPRLN